MQNYETIVVNLEHSEDEDLAAGLRRISDELPMEVRKHLNSLFTQFRRAGGREELFRRMHGQTVGELLKITPDNPTPVLKGKIDGAKFSLYNKPSDGNA